MTSEPAATEPTTTVPTTTVPTTAVPTTAAPVSDPAEAAGSDAVPVAPQQPTQSTRQTEVLVRRVPRYPRFLILGAGAGAIGTYILTAAFPSDPTIGFGPLFGYFLIYGIPLGVVLGALLAILFDYISKRRARQATAEHTTVDALPEPEQDPLT